MAAIRPQRYARTAAIGLSARANRTAHSARTNTPRPTGVSTATAMIGFAARIHTRPTTKSQTRRANTPPSATIPPTAAHITATSAVIAVVLRVFALSCTYRLARRTASSTRTCHVTHPTHQRRTTTTTMAHDLSRVSYERPNIRSFPSHTHTHPQHKNGPPHRSSHNYRNGRRLFAYPRTFHRTRSARLGSSPHTQKPCRPHRLRKPFHTHHSSNDPSSDPHTSRRNPFALPRTHTLHSRSVFHPYKAFHTPHNALYSPAYQSKPRYIRFADRTRHSTHSAISNTPRPAGQTLFLSPTVQTVCARVDTCATIGHA